MGDHNTLHETSNKYSRKLQNLNEGGGGVTRPQRDNREGFILQNQKKEEGVRGSPGQ